MGYLTADAEKWADEMGQLIFECTSLLGRPFTAYVGGATGTPEIDAWIATPDEAARLARGRLETARRIAVLLTPAIGEAGTLAWFRSPDPALGGISPADALHRSAVPQVHSLLYAMARRQAPTLVLNGAVPPR